MNANDRNSLVANLAFVALLYLGLRHDVVALTYLATGWVWVMLALYGLALSLPRKRPYTPLRPAWLFRASDVAVLGILIWYGWVATAGAWIASIVAHDLMCRPLATPGARDGRNG